MALVEIVSGLATEPAVAEVLYRHRRSLGKTPVHTRSTPGFIVNRVARPYYAESLRLLQARAPPMSPPGRGRCARRAASTWARFELMDMIGHDVNLP